MAGKDDMKRLYEEVPNLTELVTDKISGKDVPREQVLRSVVNTGKKMLSKYVTNDTSADSRYVFDPEYHFIKDVVMTALEPEKYGIREVSDLGKNLGEHDSGRMKVLKASKIPNKVFGNRYVEVLERVGKSPEEFNQNVQGYIKIHEITEMEFMQKYGISRLNADKHGKFEAYLIKSLENLALEGYGTEDILEAAVAVHSMRKPGDKFLEMTKKYNKKLGDWINTFIKDRGYLCPGKSGMCDRIMDIVM